MPGICCLAVLEAGSLKSGYRQGWPLLRAVREGPTPGLPAWLGHAFLFPVSSNVFGQISSFFWKDDSHNWIRIHPNGLILT